MTIAYSTITPDTYISLVSQRCPEAACPARALLPPAVEDR
jgi:hypothetical protein